MKDVFVVPSDSWSESHDWNKLNLSLLHELIIPGSTLCILYVIPILILAYDRAVLVME